MKVRIIRIQVTSGYTQVPNASLRDERLSYKARGLLGSLLSNRDEDWNETAESLAEKSPDGRDACRSGLRELANLGYIEYRKSQDERGKWSTEMVVYNRPKHEAAGQPEDGKPVSGATSENDAKPQVAPRTENPSSVGPDRGRKTRSRSDQAEHHVSAARTEDGNPVPGVTWENGVSAGRAEDGFSGPIQNNRLLTTEEPASKPERTLVPEQALPLVHRIQAGLPGLRWNLGLPDWLAVQTLMRTKGIDAMADYAMRVAASSAKPVFSARYFLSGWKELPDAPPDGIARPQLRAVGGTAPPESTGTKRARAAMEAGRRVQDMVDRGELPR